MTLENRETLGFDANLGNVHYFVGHEAVFRRVDGAAVGPVPFATFAFLTPIASRAPDFFCIPPGSAVGSGISGRNLNYFGVVSFDAPWFTQTSASAGGHPPALLTAPSLPVPR